MKSTVILILCLVITNFAQQPTGKDILKRIDRNMSSETQVIQSKMIIHGARGSRTIESKSWTEGTEKSFTEYLSPVREKGTKMLKLKDNLWMYSPSTDRIIKISGHMLRQSVMGSDLSFEDMMEDKKLERLYEAAVIGTDTIDNTSCWVLELKAATKDIAYDMRKLWVDEEKFVPLRQELYARSGKLLKKIEFKDFQKTQNRWFPRKMVFKDMLKGGDGTEFIIDSIQFNAGIPGHIFSKASLRR